MAGLGGVDLPLDAENSAAMWLTAESEKASMEMASSSWLSGTAAASVVSAMFRSELGDMLL